MPEPPPPYEPRPLDTSSVKLTEDILQLTELLARNTHEIWARQRLADGWRYGPNRDDDRKEHPSLVPYETLPESEKEYDRNTALETLRTLIALGYQVEKA
ncbi:MAG: RyR domain-containing protein [Terriglobia bacterium]